jgi:hypothetical protein
VVAEDVTAEDTFLAAAIEDLPAEVVLPEVEVPEVEVVVAAVAKIEADDVADDDTDRMLADLAALDAAATEPLVLAEPAAVTEADDGDDDLMVAGLMEDAARDALTGAVEVDASVDASQDMAAEPVEDDDNETLYATLDAPAEEMIADDEAEDDLADDDLADDDLADDDLADLEAAIADAPVVDAVEAAEYLPEDDLPEDDLVEDDLAEDDLPDMHVADVAAADITGTDQAEPDEVEVAEVAEADPADADLALIADEPVAEHTAEVAPEPVMLEPAAPAPATPDVPMTAERARARVIRVRRSAEIALDRKPAAPAPTPVAAGTDAALPDDAEADLQRELQALDVDAAAPAEVEDPDADLRRQLAGLAFDATPATPAPAQEAAPTALDSEVADDAVRRLMDQTQSQMAVPENRRRLSSIAHLKAAVAATIAERFGSKPKPVEDVEATRSEPYRNDLARAVRPGRPAGAPGDPPAPLVLVSEQRIDRPAPPAPAAAPAPIVPVRPRRVTVQAAVLRPEVEDDLDDSADMETDNIFGDTKGFAEFADRVGANDLPELLEAAAAYAAAIEGRDAFTRPQLLNQISTITGDDVTREDELRSFGALLRDGRIVKVKRGQFALTESSSYLAEARRIAG